LLSNSLTQWGTSGVPIVGMDLAILTGSSQLITIVNQLNFLSLLVDESNPFPINKLCFTYISAI
jgi:hypothetical protein